MKLIKCINLLIIFLVTSFSSIDLVESEVYTVGDQDGWATGTNYLTWSEKYNFTVGDVLAFVYVKGQHNTYEVTQSTYQSCDVSTGVVAKYESGNDQVTLKEARKYWFICQVDEHCFGGMRFGVDVKQGRANSSGDNTTPEPMPNSPPIDDGSGSFNLRGRGRDCLFAFVIILLMMCY